MANRNRNRNRAGAAASQLPSGGGGGATWASIWADQAHIFDLSPDSVNLSGSNLVSVANIGSADSLFKQQTVQPPYAETDADFNGLPSLTMGGLGNLIARNAADSANLTDSNFIAANAGFFSILVKLTTETGEDTTTYTDLPGVWSSAGGSLALGYAGADQMAVAGGFQGGFKTAIGALARNTAALLTWVKTSTHLQLYVNTTKVETAATALSLFGGAVYIGRSGGNDKVAGKLGPWAGSTSVPEDLETRIAAACTLAGIS